jgi:hypothetical protein
MPRPAAPTAAHDPDELSAQLVMTAGRVRELQSLLEEAEIENQHLTKLLEDSFVAGGRPGLSSAASVNEEAASTSLGGPGLVGHGSPGAAFSYGHVNNLALSAVEQRLALAEAQRDELSQALREANALNKHLEAEAAGVRRQLSGGGRRRSSDAASRADSEELAAQVWTEETGRCLQLTELHRPAAVLMTCLQRLRQAVPLCHCAPCKQRQRNESLSSQGCVGLGSALANPGHVMCAPSIPAWISNDGRVPFRSLPLQVRRANLQPLTARQHPRMQPQMQPTASLTADSGAAARPAGALQ